MAFIFADGFDDYAAQTDLVPRGWDIKGVAGWSLPAGRLRGKMILSSSSSENVGYLKSFPTCGEVAGNEFYFSFAFYPTTIPGSSQRFFGIGSGADQTNNLALHLSSGGAIILVREGFSTLATAAAACPTAATFYRIEGKVLVADSGGNVEIKVNGTTVINFTGDTRASTVVGVGAVTLSAASFQPGFDDLLLWNGSGTDMTGFLGDFKIDYLNADATGYLNQGTPNTGTNLGAVDETTVDNGDTDYITHNTAGQVDMFGMTSLPDTPDSIIGVVGVISARGDAIGPRKGKVRVRSGGVNADSAEFAVSGRSEYTRHQAFFKNDPSTSALWAASAIPSLEVGFTLTV